MLSLTKATGLALVVTGVRFEGMAMNLARRPESRIVAWRDARANVVDAAMVADAGVHANQPSRDSFRNQCCRFRTKHHPVG